MKVSLITTALSETTGIPNSVGAVQPLLGPTFSPGTPSIALAEPVTLTGIWSTEARRLAILDSIDRLLGNIWDQESTSKLAAYYDLEPNVIGAFFFNVSPTLAAYAPEPRDNICQSINLLFTLLRGGTTQLQIWLEFSNCYDWQQSLHRKVQTFSERLDLVTTGLSFYRALELPVLPTRLAYTPWDDAGDPRSGMKPARKISFSDGDYCLELWPGITETRSGLEFRIALSDGTKLFSVGCLTGSSDLIIVNIQGTNTIDKRDAARHYERLKGKFHGQHPFDWLLNNIEVWAREQNYSHLHGYGHRLSAWIEQHFQKGDFPESRRASFERIYERRFEDRGMMAVNGKTHVYAKPLDPRNPSENIPGDHLLISKLMQCP